MGKAFNKQSTEKLKVLKENYTKVYSNILKQRDNCDKNSDEYKTLSKDLKSSEKILKMITNEIKNRKEKQIINKKDKEQQAYEENKKEYLETLEKLKSTKKISITKTTFILLIEGYISYLSWSMGAPMILSLAITAATAFHLGNRIRKRVIYDELKDNAKYLKKAIDEYENKDEDKKKVSKFSKVKGLFKFKNKNKDNKKKKDIKIVKENNNNNKYEEKQEQIEEKKLNTEDKKANNTSGKIEELKKAKEEIINGVYGLKKDQIIQDRVNVREICEFYGTNNTNPSYAKTSKEKVMVKK